mgnify:CR=1 FL=1
MAITAPSQIYQLYADTQPNTSLDDLTVFQPNDAGATRMGANTWRSIMKDLGVPVTEKISLTSAEILALNTTPKVLVVAQGAGYVIQPIAVQMFLDYGTTTYATNTTARVKYSGISGNFATNSVLSSVSDQTASQSCLSSLQFSSAIDNVALVLDVQTGDPTTGDGTLNVYITYCVITL